MIEQIETLFVLAEKAKKVAQNCYNGNCSHVDVNRDVSIYFADGYDTFSISMRNGACLVELYRNSISFNRHVSYDTISEVISCFEQVILEMENRPKIDKQQEKIERKKRLLQELEKIDSE